MDIYGKGGKKYFLVNKINNKKQVITEKHQIMVIQTNQKHKLKTK